MKQAAISLLAYGCLLPATLPQIFRVEALAAANSHKSAKPCVNTPDQAFTLLKFAALILEHKSKKTEDEDDEDSDERCYYALHTHSNKAAPLIKAKATGLFQLDIPRA